jgi:GNAT superfamily N-acetyltransferase
VVISVAGSPAGRGVPVFRTPVQIRDAAPDDAPALMELWASGPLGGRAPEREAAAAPHETSHHGGTVRDAESAIARAAADPDQRVLVATIEDRVAGAVHLSRGTFSPVHNESAIYVMHLQVAEDFRRHGVGHALMEATVTWAEEKDTSHVIAAAAVASRDANRFMARLGLAQVAVIRGTTTAALRAKLPVEPPAAARVGTRTHRSVGAVLAQRRSMRRAQTRPS